MNKILLIEDDELLGATLAENLILESQSVDWVKNGKEGLAVAEKQLHDLIVLDIMLPQLTGLQVLQELRKKSNTPVLLISAKGTSQDRIRGLELQADDYLVKPFHLKEFLLRVQNMIRRRTQEDAKKEKVKIGNATFDFEALSVSLSSGASEILTDKESRLIRLLLSRANKVVSRQDILDLVWGYQNYPSARTVDNFIVRIRKWIENDPQEPKLVISHRGIGYSLKMESE
jgi:two-component system alkaline phosphatase synthesis response regulator PhoP